MLEKIVNKNLRDFLEDYDHFTSLSDKEKTQYIKQILELSDEKQQEVYMFLEKEDEKAQVKILDAFYEQINIATKQIGSLVYKEKEKNSKSQDEDSLNKILEEI